MESLTLSTKNNWIKHQTILMLTALLFTLSALYPCFENGWVNWDDPVYVNQNGVIRDFTWSGVKNMFKPENRVLDTYTPLTLVSLAADYAVGQNDATVYHSTNVLLHLINVLLVYLLIYKLIRRNLLAFFVAVVFGIHPMHVESVAWVTERKDLLFSLFFLASCIQYLSYIRYSVEKKRIKALTYIIALFLGTAAMLAKPQAVSLPLVLVLFHFWEEKQFNFAKLISTLPFFILSLLTGLMAMQFMNDNESSYGFIDQILLSGHACFLYLIKAIVPFSLSHQMDIPLVGEIPKYYYLTTLFSISLLSIVSWFGRKNRWVVFGVGFFIVTLIFSLHILKINSGIAYERFSYLPYIGLFMLLAHYIEVIKSKFQTYAKLIIAGVVCILFLYGYLANQQSRVWKNDETLWTSSIEKDPDNKLGWCKRARYYTSISLFDKALADQQKCIELSLNKADALVNLGNIYMRTGNPDLALIEYSESINQEPNYSLPYSCRGVLLIQLGKEKEGLADLEKAVELDSSISSYRINLGLAYELKKDYKSAINFYTKALELNPYDYNAWKYRGSLSLLMGNLSWAIADLENAVTLNPQLKEAWYQLSKANFRNNSKEVAKKQFEKALEMGAIVEDDYKRNFDFE